MRTFGSNLKELRLGANIGLRRFADMIGMKPSNLSNIERDKVPPPANKETIDLICDKLILSNWQRDGMFDLAAIDRNRVPADVADIIKKQPHIPVLVRTIAGKQLSDKKLRQLTKYIEKYY